jgi:hypothetical protein
LCMYVIAGRLSTRHNSMCIVFMVAAADGPNHRDI